MYYIYKSVKPLQVTLLFFLKTTTKQIEFLDMCSWVLKGENEHDAEKFKFCVNSPDEQSPMTLLLVVLLTETEEKGFHTHRKIHWK